MTIDEFAEILRRPAGINTSQSHELDNIVEEFPYFQAARVLQLKMMFEQGNYRYNKALKKAAVHVADRSVLYSFIHEARFPKTPTPPRPEAVPAAKPTAPTIEEKPVVQPISKIETPVAPPPKLYKRTTYYDESPVENPIMPKIPSAKTDSEESTDNLYSFAQWLKNISEQKQSTESQPTVSESDTNDTISEKFKLIDRFLEINPKIETNSIDQANFNTPNVNLAKQANSADPQQLMTETLAQVYVNQKKYKQAIQAYEILILKNPEKSSYFADQIKNIKNLQQNN